MTLARDFATPNLPSRDFDVTVAFYGMLGFMVNYRSPGWLILSRDGLILEFFPWSDFDPSTSSFGACLRLHHLDDFVGVCIAGSVPVQAAGWPRLSLPRMEPSGERIGYLVDPDCNLLRLVDENRAN